MSALEEINTYVDIEFTLANEPLCERRWNFVPDVGDRVELEVEKKTVVIYEVVSKLYRDRKTGFFSGYASQEIRIDLRKVT